MEDYQETSPFWPKPTVVNRRRSCLSRLLSLPVVPVIVVVALFFVVPPFLSLAGNLKLKPSWDSFSVLLVLFAVLSGVFAKRNDAVLGEPVTAAPVARPWLDEGVSKRTTGRSGSLRRSGGSHKDLRRESPPVCDDRFRWFDDFEIIKRSSPDRRFGTGENFDDVKVIPVDTCVLRSSPEKPISPPEKKEIASQNEAEIEKTSSPSPKRDHGLEKKEIASRNEAEIEKLSSPSPPDLQDSKRALESAENLKNPTDSEQKQGKFERRKNMAIKEITMVLQLASIYNHNQIKRITRKSKPKAKNNSGSDSNSPLKTTNPSATMLPPPSPAPPPPPLPPPPSIFHNLVKKGLSKNKNNWKKIKSLTTSPPTLGTTQTQISPPREQQQPPHLFTTMPPPSPAPPPPPMPPPPSIFHNLVKKGLNKKNWKKIKSLSLNTPSLSTTETQISPPPEMAPPPKFSRRRNSSAAGKPPLVPAAALQSRTADPSFVRVKSTQSSLESVAVDRPLIRDGPGGSDGGEGVGPVWCVSPDVNVKADSFIARLKDGWRLEKMNSVREKKDVGLES